jgi:hypothetical protein
MVAYFDNLEDAQHAVSQLSEDGFPADKLDIVTAEMHPVDPTTRRPSRVRTVLARLLRAANLGRDLGSVRALTTRRYNLVARDGTAGHAWSLLHKAGLDSRTAAPLAREAVGAPV